MNSTTWATPNVSQESGNVSRGQGNQMTGAVVDQFSSQKVTSVIKCTAIMLIAIIGAFGNSLTLTAIRKTPSLWTQSNILIASLTSAHLYMSFIQLPYFAIFNLWVYVFTDNSCYYIVGIAIMYPFPKIIAHAIYYHFIIIAVDRYIAIVYPFQYETIMTVRVIKCLIGGSYVYGLVVVLIYFSYLQYVDWSSCGLPYSTAMTAAIDCSAYVTVVLVTCLVYSRIFLVALKHRNKIGTVTVIDQEATNRIQTIEDSRVGNPTVVSKSETEHSKMKKIVTEFKASGMTAVLVCAHTLPLIPYEIGRIFQAVGNTQPYAIKLLDVGTAFGLLNSGFDWVIYGIMNRTFRRAYLRVLKIQRKDQNFD